MSVKERFLRYVMIPTMSDGASKTCPSSEKQWVLAKLLADELKAMGLSDVSISEYGYVSAVLPSNCEKDVNTIGLIAHMDTSDAASDENIKPRCLRYEGGDILLNAEKSIVMKTSDYPYLDSYRGQELIVTDGTTLLGADDKAGVAEIMEALAMLIASGKEHGTVKVCFTPDEEIGRGADRFDVAGFAADYAYTVDGGALGELEYENFNAGGAHVTIHGVSIHPGSAKDKMKNAALIACEFNALLPADQIPAKTEGYEGFFHLSSLRGETELVELSYIIRDHDFAKYEEKKAVMLACGEEINRRYGAGTAEVKLHDSYRNMKEKIEPCFYIVERAKKAMTECGVVPRTVPIRGGTDGARLSYMGLPCPNFCTGGENFHSRFEFVSVEAMEKITEILARLITDAVAEEAVR